MIAPLFTPQAERELRSAAAWIAEDNASAARALLQAALRAATRLRDRPMLGRTVATLAPPRYRFWSLRGFPYVLVYDSEFDPPHVVRVIHTAQDLNAALAGLRET